MFPKWYLDPAFNSLHYLVERCSREEESVSQGDDHLYAGITTCMLKSKKLDAKLWEEAMNAEAYMQKKVPHSSMKGKTLFESYFRHKPDVSNLRVFGSTAWAQIPLDKRRDLQPQRI